MNLFVIGSSNIDLVIYLKRIPKIGETVIGGEFKKIFGGKGANQAVSAKKAGAKVKFITQLGDDSFGLELKTYYNELGLDCKYILTDNKHPTGLAQILVSERGENSIAVAPGSNGTLTFQKLKPYLEEIANADLVLIQFEIPIQTVISIIDFCYDNKVRVIVNPAPAVCLPSDVLNKIWMITPNESELELLTDISVNNKVSAIEAARKLINSGIENCIVTLGDKGSMWLSSNGVFEFSIPAIKAIDTTAAGDVFNGCLAHCVLNKIPLKSSIIKAHTAASLSVTKKGAQTSIPNDQEIFSFSKNFNVKVIQHD